MNEEKQIEEMALVLSEGGCGKECDCIQGDKFNCHLLHSASLLYNAGYRKASEVAKEIFEEIERETKNHGIAYTQRKIAELKNKYTEGEE